MKIQFKRSIVLEYYKRRLDELWDHTFNKWDEIEIEDMIDNGKTVDLITEEGDLLLHVPKDSFDKF